MKLWDIQVIIGIMQKEDIKSIEVLPNDGAAGGNFYRVHYGDTFGDGIDQITDFDFRGTVIE